MARTTDSQSDDQVSTSRRGRLFGSGAAPRFGSLPSPPVAAPVNYESDAETRGAGHEYEVIGYAVESPPDRTVEPEDPELQKTVPSVTKKDRKSAGRKVQPKFEYPEPDKESELQAISERSSELSHVSHTVAGLGLNGADVQVQVAGLHELSGRCEELARQIGMHAVAEGQITQRELSRLLSVHELTVHRWVKAAQQQQDL